jgi:glucokinase
MLLAGDIGGTKTLIALLELLRSGADQTVTLKTIRQQKYVSKDYPSLDRVVADFLAGGTGPQPVVQAACFGVAGAIHDGRCRATNLPWSMDERDLARVVGCDRGRVKLLNDVEASAYGMLFLSPGDLVDLNPAALDMGQGNIAVVAAGTGLGESILYWDGKRHHPVASEGGHCSFAPQSEREVELWRHLRAKFNGHVSYERILSGQGFSDLFDFLAQSGGYTVTPALDQALAPLAGDTGKRNALITEFGLKKDDPLCREALGLFLSIYGAEAGNMALKCVARGGVYLAGGIAPKMRDAFALGTFLEGFMAKGRFATMLSGTRVRLALNQEAGLIGSGYYALNHLAG